MKARGVPNLDDLVWLWRCKAQLRSGKRVDPLGITQRGKLDFQGMVLFHHFRLVLLQLLDHVAVTDALKVLPGKNHNEKKSQSAQDEQAETLPALLVINFTLQAGIVDVFYEIDLRIWSTARDRLVPGTALRTG
jgi:hypothetical protein